MAIEIEYPLGYASSGILFFVTAATGDSSIYFT